MFFKAILISGSAAAIGALMWPMTRAAAAPAGTVQAKRSPPQLLNRVDHLVYATPDLELGIERIHEVLGIRAATGGSHPGRGTRNALVALGTTSYLEIIGPDPDQPAPAGGRPFRIDALKAPALVAWAAKGQKLDALAADAKTRGVALGPVVDGSRKRPDGVTLAWRYTDPRTVVAEGVVPFFIDWGASPHPARTAAAGATLVALRAEHPNPARARAALAALGIDLPVARARRAGLVATIESPKGLVDIR